MSIADEKTRKDTNMVTRKRGRSGRVNKTEA